MPKKNQLFFKSTFTLSLWNINERKAIDNEEIRKSNVLTGEKASRRLFILTTYALADRDNISVSKKLVSQKLLIQIESDISEVRKKLLLIKKNLSKEVKNGLDELSINSLINNKEDKEPFVVKINVDINRVVASYIRLYMIFDTIDELIYKKNKIGLISYQERKEEQRKYSTEITSLMKKIILSVNKIYRLD